MKGEHPDLVELTEWAVEARYPGEWSEATEADACAALQQARGVWESVWADFMRHDFKVILREVKIHLSLFFFA